MENLPVNNGNGQSFGYTLYETTIASSGVLSAFVRDRGQVGASPLDSCGLVVLKPDNRCLTLFPLTNLAVPSVWRWPTTVSSAVLFSCNHGHSFFLCAWLNALLSTHSVTSFSAKQRSLLHLPPVDPWVLSVCSFGRYL